MRQLKTETKTERQRLGSEEKVTEKPCEIFLLRWGEYQPKNMLRFSLGQNDFGR